MRDQSFLQWPFLEDRHRTIASGLERWAESHLAKDHHLDVDKACRELVTKLGEDGWLKYTAPGEDSGNIDVRTLALIRETLARHSGLADFVFAMQGLGAGPISLFGDREQKARWLPRTRAGKTISAFALSEPGSGSDVANMTTSARRDGNGSWCGAAMNASGQSRYGMDARNRQPERLI